MKGGHFLKICIFSYICLSFGPIIPNFKEKYNHEKSKFVVYSILIQKGQSFIVNKETKKALFKYKLALQSTVNPRASDCFTAMQLAALSNQHRLFKKFMNQGFRAGLKPSHIYSDSLLHNFIKKEKYELLTTKKYSRFKKKYKKSLNKFLLDSITKISEYDNRWKKHYLDSLSNIDTLNQKRYSVKYDSIVSNLVEQKLMPLIAKHGYPGERQIGIERVGNPTDPYNYSINNNRALFILLHYYSFPRDCEFNDMLYQEVLIGNMTPQQYASIMDFQAKYSSSNQCSPGYYNQWWTSEKKEDFKSINKRRSKIGLGTFQLEDKKYKRGREKCYQYDDGIYEHIKIFYWCG